jgi:hypothetical protein
MKALPERLKLVRAYLIACLFFFFGLGFVANIYRYFVLEHISNIVAQAKAPVDSEKIITALETHPPSEARHHLLVTTVTGGNDSILRLQSLVMDINKTSQDVCLSDAGRWAFALLFLSLLLRVERKLRLARPKEP